MSPDGHSGEPDPEGEREGESGSDADIVRIHDAVLREPPDPGEGRERGPWWLWVAIVLAIFGGGFYLGRYSGTFFENAVHVGYIRPSMVGTDPMGPGGMAPVRKEPPEKMGQSVYTANCVTCHQADGKGVPGNFPPLAASPWVIRDQETVVRILLHGLSGPIEVNGETYNGAMPAWRNVLSDERIAAVASYIRSNFGNRAPEVAPETVAKLRDAGNDRVQPWTSQELAALRTAL